MILIVKELHFGVMLMTKTGKKVQKTTTIPNEERLKQLRQLYPECLTEGEIDLEKLHNLLLCESGGGVFR